MTGCSTLLVFVSIVGQEVPL